MADWPAALPQAFEADGFNFDLVGDDLIENSPEMGPPLSRPRSSAAARTMAGQMVLTDEQIETLQDFITDEIGRGSLTFNFPKQIEGSGTDRVKFAKGGLPKIVGTINEDTYRVSFNLWVMP